MQDELLKQYIASLRQRIGRIDSLQAKLEEGNSKADENIRLLAHSLHGSGASFGFPEISEAASAVEHAAAGELGTTLATLKGILENVVADQAGAKTAAPTAPADAPPQRDAGNDSPQTPPAPAAARVVKPVREGIDILVVDDDPAITDMITASLDALPGAKRVKVVNTAAKCQEAIVKKHYDLIIMDLVLPDRDGRELIQEIKLEFRIKSPLLVLSAIQNDSVRVECMSLGADKFLTKPIYDEDLLREVRKLLGKETKRKLTLVPKDGEAVEDDGEDEEKARVLKGRSILVVEDDKMQGELIRQRLAGEGASVKHALNGREAMQLLRTQAFSLAILDVKMPVMDGFEVLERIKGELNLDIPVIMVTAMGSEEDIIRGYDLGVTDYILKPFSDVLLVARVKSLLKTAD